MPDITKCTATNCLWYAMCYRKTAPDSEFQWTEDFSADPDGFIYWDDVLNKWQCKFFINKDKVAK